jgi:hypothetical protein
MSKYGDMAQFPVKVQVPLLFTVYALLAFKKFRPIGAEDGIGPDFFEVPQGYRCAGAGASASRALPAPPAAPGDGMLGSLLARLLRPPTPAALAPAAPGARTWRS